MPAMRQFQAHLAIDVGQRMVDELGTFPTNRHVSSLLSGQDRKALGDATRARLVTPQRSHILLSLTPEALSFLALGEGMAQARGQLLDRRIGPTVVLR